MQVKSIHVQYICNILLFFNICDGKDNKIRIFSSQENLQKEHEIPKEDFRENCSHQDSGVKKYCNKN